MPSSRKKFKRIVVFFLGLGIIYCCSAKELPQNLNKSQEYLRVGRLSEARKIAESFHNSFPNDLEALLLLGRIDFEKGDYLASKRWFQGAARFAPSHPIISLYKRMFLEIEHRRGEPIADLTPQPRESPQETADQFRKGWFGPNFVQGFGKAPEPPKSPLLITATPTMGILEARSLDFLANEALQKQWFLKAYLLYKDLLRKFPENREFRFSLAKSALGIRRKKEAREILKKLLKEDGDNRDYQKLYKPLQENE